MTKKIDRRNFLKKSVLATGSVTVLSTYANNKVAKKTVAKSTYNPYSNLKEIQDQNLFIRPLKKNLTNQPIKVGIVGVGGRGAGAAINALRADKNTVLWSACDIKSKRHIKSKLNYAQRKFPKRGKIANNRIFTGFESYKDVLASGIDMVILTATPAFRPRHIKTSVEAGKHIFAEKPLAIDAVGLRSVIQSTKKAREKNLCFMTGFMWRYTPAMQDVASHLLNGDFGKITTIHARYFAGGRPNALSYKAKFIKNDTFGNYIKKWQNYLELAGDSVVEQSIHTIDKISWLMGDSRNVSCFANGGQAIPFPSNTFDNFSVIYQYGDGRQASMLSRQYIKASWDEEERYFTENGYALRTGQFYNNKNKKVWQSKKSKAYGYTHEHKILTSYIRAGKVFDDSQNSITSNGMAIMARMTAYTGKKVSWKKLMNSKEKLFDHSISYSHNMPYSIRDLAIPGITKLI